MEIIRYDEGTWVFEIDPSHAPEYIMIKITGMIEPSRLEELFQKLLDIMDEIVGTGQVFCPLIYDVREGRPDKITIPTFMKIFPQMTRRLSRLYIAISPEQEGTDFFIDFIKMMASMNRKMNIVSSLEEALEQL